MMLKATSPVWWAILGAMGISLVFYLVQALGMLSWTEPISFSQERWYFLLPLVIGFGTQMGLYRAIHLKVRPMGTATVAASGGVSTGAMLACCMHNLAALLPVLGISGLAVFFSTYQNYIFLGSILVMLGGVMYMWRKYRTVSRMHAS